MHTSKNSTENYCQRVSVPILILALLLIVTMVTNPLELAYSQLDPSQTSLTRQRPVITLDGENVFVVWPENTTTTNSEIFLARSADGGATFEDTFNLSNTSGRSANPVLVKSGENIFAVWLENNNNTDNWEVFFRASPDNGVNFNEIMNISNTTGASEDPEIAADEENVVVAWWDNTNGTCVVLYRASTDSGTTFGSTIALNATTGIRPIE